MEVKDAIYQRRTVRKFKALQVPEDLLFEILEAGTWAPSHNNTQPWEFTLIGPETRVKLLAIYGDIVENGPLKNPHLPEERKQMIRLFAKNFGDAPIIIVVTSPPAHTEMDHYEFPLSVAAAIQNIFLSAWDKGITGVWLSFGSSPNVKNFLNIPDGSVIAGILAMGYADIIPPAQPRISVSQKLIHLP